MMKHAYVENGTVIEVIEPLLDAANAEVPVNQRFHPDIVAALVADPGAGAVVGGTWDGIAFGPVPTPPAPDVVDLANTVNAEAERRCTLIVPHQSRRVIKLRGNPNDPDLVAMEAVWTKADALAATLDGLTEQQRRDFDATDDAHWV